MKKILFSSVPVKLVIVMGVVYYIFPWLVIFIGTMSQPNPPKPQITYGEFPFKLVYEIDGARKVIEDTLICEYDGIGMDEGRGKFRKWKEHLASGNKKLLLSKTIGGLGIAFENEKTLKQEIYYDPGPAWYYMGDYESSTDYKHGFPDASFSEKYFNGGASYGDIAADELLKKFKIKLISWDYTEPIKNNFS